MRIYSLRATEAYFGIGCDQLDNSGLLQGFGRLLRVVSPLAMSELPRREGTRVAGLGSDEPGLDRLRESASVLLR